MPPPGAPGLCIFCPPYVSLMTDMRLKGYCPATVVFDHPHPAFLPARRTDRAQAGSRCPCVPSGVQTTISLHRRDRRTSVRSGLLAVFPPVTVFTTAMSLILFGSKL